MGLICGWMISLGIIAGDDSFHKAKWYEIIFIVLSGWVFVGWYFGKVLSKSFKEEKEATD